jgi:RNA polymerase sigma factor (sigma-70 family)
MTSDAQELLARFVNHGSESAFRELVTRYFDLVYSTAVRLVDGDAHRAEDVAQMVFSDLARMASKLSNNTLLGGWLHRHTCFVARTTMRGERRRQAREKQAVEMNALDKEGESVVAQVAPILDEAINELGADDRDAILLRFFERRNLRSVGEALGMSENAAQKRVARALQELGTLLQRRGVTLSGAALASGLATGAVKAAPVGLALSVAGAVLANVSTTAGFGVTSAKVAAIVKLKIGIAAAVVVVMAGLTVLVLQRQPGVQTNSDKRLPNQQSREQQEGNAVIADPGSRETVAAGSASEVLNPPGAGEGDIPGHNVAVTRPKQPSVALPQPVVHDGAVGATVRLYAKAGSRVRIEGTSNIHDWQVEGSLVGGVMDAGRGIPMRPGTTIQSGPVHATAEAFVMVRSLKSIEKDGRPYSDLMDEVIYESLKARRFPKIQYRLLEISFKAATNFNHAVQYEYQSRGELSIAGVTNELSMPVFLLPLGSDKLKILGRTTIKMTSFQIVPPAPKIALGMIKTGDEVVIAFSWMLGLRKESEQQPSAALASSQTAVQQGQISSTSTAVDQADVIPAGAIQFINTQLVQVLAVYADLSQAQLDVDDRLSHLPSILIRFTNSEPVTRGQAIALLDDALLEQAGIVVTHPEPNRVKLELRH